MRGFSQKTLDASARLLTEEEMRRLGSPCWVRWLPLVMGLLGIAAGTVLFHLVN